MASTVRPCLWRSTTGFSIYSSNSAACCAPCATELSDGTVRFLLWAAALLSPQPPSLMVLNEPRTMLEFLNTVPVTDAEDDCDAVEIELYKELGETRVHGLGMLTTPPWDYGSTASRVVQAAARG